MFVYNGGCRGPRPPEVEKTKSENVLLPKLSCHKHIFFTALHKNTGWRQCPCPLPSLKLSKSFMQ